MYKKNTYSWLKHWDFTLLDILCMEIAFWMAVIVRNGFTDKIRFPVYRHSSIALIFLNICIVFFIQSYKGVLRRSFADEVRSVCIHVTCVILLMLVYMYMSQEAYFYSRFAFVLFWVFYVALTLLGRMALKRWLCKNRRENPGTRSLLIIVTDEKAKELVEQVSGACYGNIRVTGVALMKPSDPEEKELAGVPIVACGKDILGYIKENWVDEVFLAPARGTQCPGEMLNGFSEMGITTHLRIADADEPGMSRSVEKMGGCTVLTESIRMETPNQAALKRLMDIAGGIVGVVLTGIVFLFVAPAIYVRSPGPVFFSQTRVGKNGKQFKIYKFRSMYMDAEERKKELLEKNTIKDGMMFKIEDDPRIIKGIGHLIRETSLDELPQFWNVLKGDMSLVGTRPPTMDEYRKYDFHHRKRLATKPGITGMWQVSGRSDIKDFEEVVRLDTKYIQEWSLMLDVKIILKTVKVVLSRKGSA